MTPLGFFSNPPELQKIRAGATQNWRRRGFSPDGKGAPAPVAVPPKVLFLHGLSSTGSSKTWFLRSLGFDVLAPRLSDWSFCLALRAAQDACDEFRPAVVVGSSRGGAVAMALSRPDVPLVLLAPAWRFCGIPPRVVARQAVVIHSPADRWVRFANSRELCQQNPAVRLVVAGHGHRLNDPAARAALADVLDDLIPTEENLVEAD